MATIKAKLKSTGFVVLQDTTELRLLSLAQDLGTPVPSVAGGELTDFLGAPRDDGYSESEFASVYRDGTIPYHTDCAYYDVPPRFGIMRLTKRSASDRRTLFLDFKRASISGVMRRILKTELWRVDGALGNNKQLRVLQTEQNSGALMLRWDTNCMRPYFKRHARAKAVIERVCSAPATFAIDWEQGKTVVFDNWRFLHALEAPRAVATLPEGQKRIIERVLVST